MMTSVVRLLS